MNLRRRSPSPVVTGKVSSFRNKFENSTGSPTNNNGSTTLPRNTRLKSRQSLDLETASKPKNSPFRERNSLVQYATSVPSSNPYISPYALSKDSSSTRLPAHFVPISSSVNRTPSLRSPRLSLGSNVASTDAATLAATTFLRCTLPRKSLQDTPPTFDPGHNKLRGPFGYNRI